MPIEPRALGAPAPKEIPLSDAPLIRVIAQVRFPQILAIRNPDTVALFQEKIRMTYPILKEEAAHHVTVLPGVAPEITQIRIWRFLDRAEKPNWRVSLGSDFVALEAMEYGSRVDFLARLRDVVSGVESSFRPAEAQRLGIRYIDRVVEDGFDQLAQLVQPKVLGITHPGTAPPADLSAAVVHSITETSFEAAEGQLVARWGILSPNGTYDVDAVEPIVGPSWVLDLDMYTNAAFQFDTHEILRRADEFCQRIYYVFREIVTDDFLKFYGGKP